MFGIGMPGKQWTDLAKEENMYTPDIADIEQRGFHFVFICDDRMHLRSGYEFISEHTVHMNTVYTEENFSFYKYLNNGQSPIILPMEGGVRPIRGEWHITTTEGLQYLDKLYGNGVEYNRKRVKVILPFRSVWKKKNKAINGKPLPPCLDNFHTHISSERRARLRIWMYVANESYWNDHIDGGYHFERIPHYHPNKLRSWLESYYFYVEKRSE